MEDHQMEELSLVQRKTIYRARRGLKEIDVYFDLYVKQYYLKASSEEQRIFEQLIEYEDPDILDWFMEVSNAPNIEIKHLIWQLKKYLHG
ncbi:succinate dehydrogenase assembly factor 2 [Acinetobacter sp. ESL0695]|nr:MULTISPECIES: succinate dehydrogenase assembly factor 2 [Acinetobacter]WEV48592.1 succinate dehydrogenase assembly factor 2 [Acinetobacter sp. ESL0695]